MRSARAVPHRFAHRRAARALALGAVAAAAAIAPQVAPAAAAGLSGVDLSTYVRVGRYDLPAPWNRTPPSGSLLAQEASSVTYDWDTGTLFVVGDGGTSVVQVTTTGQYVDSMTLPAGSSPAGNEFYDTEGITYIGSGQFVITEERYRQVDRFTYVPNTTLTRAATKTVKLGTTIGNVGLEGVSNDPQTGGFLLAKETDPQGLFQTNIDWDAGTATNGSATTENSTNLFDPTLLGLGDVSDVYALANVPTLAGTPDASHLLIISQQSGKVVNADRSGTVHSSLQLVADADNPLSIQDQTDEGVTLGPDGTLYVVNEQGGGASHPQLWVFNPSLVANTAPTAVTLTHQVSSIAENTSTASRFKVADVSVTDDGLGTNNLSVTGPDASSFEVDGTGLYLKAGTTLNRTTKPSYAVNVAVDDPSLGTSPDASSSAFTLTVTAAAALASVKVTEVSPWSSGNSPYAADWFELTNTGTTTVSLAGWKMNDSAASAATAVALNGVTSLAPGASAIFLQGTASDFGGFESAWFGATVPSGFQIGSYSTAGPGLSTSGDAVTVFDASDALVTGISFGTSTTGKTFDNAVGAGSSAAPFPAVATLSATGTNGAFTSPATETGSPGTIGTPAAAVPSVKVTEVSPIGSSASYGADWFELTNTGSTAVDLTGWKIDDSSNGVATAVPLAGVSSLAPGKSAVFLEGDDTKPALFKTAWFGGSVPTDLAVGTYTGSGVGLSSSGDGVNVFDAAGNRVTGVAFGAATAGVSFDNKAGAGSSLDTAPPTISTLSVAGTNGAITSATGGETGSPGTLANAPTVASVKVTEVNPTGSSASYGADWFELTNTGSTAVDLTGWKVDDGSNALASAVALTGVPSLAPGTSAVFLEGDAAKVALFSTAWFGGAVPSDVVIGTYSGSGIGLSDGGDQVNVFDADGNRVTGVAFGAATLGVSFDNAAGLGSKLTVAPPTIRTPSVAGVKGAYVSPGTAETGSPATLAPDVTPPTITFTGNAGTYTTTQAIAISCTAADGVRGSGIATTNCADVTGLAGALGVGEHTITASAIDKAGNAGTGSVTFTVTAPPSSGGGSTGGGGSTSAPSTSGGDTPSTGTPAPAPPTTTPVTTPTTTPATGTTTTAPATPKVSAATSAKRAALGKGVRTTLSGLQARSTVTLTVRLKGKTLKTITATVNGSGAATVPLKLSAKQLAKLRGRTLTLRYVVTGADGKQHTLTTTLKVK
jgi:uncharacterized protein YjiK